MQNIDNLWAAFACWQFGVAAVAILTLISTVKKAFRAANSDVLSRGWAKVAMAVANVALGTVVALPKGFLLGDTYSQRLLVGICAGFLSSFIYTILVKRVKKSADSLTDDQIDVECDRLLGEHAKKAKDSNT